MCAVAIIVDRLPDCAVSQGQIDCAGAVGQYITAQVGTAVVKRQGDSCSVKGCNIAGETDNMGTGLVDVDGAIINVQRVGIGVSGSAVCRAGLGGGDNNGIAIKSNG
ncbi:hypothetical protein SPSIL_041160 [Sporomusa silvacetica DSM 10669]|uniref:Uncharacterized protein n=1 Tax=Sporomusa silvacetica DSM 10669 TaxID=1123289 RepID=A0ABZ3IQE0_9FIRM|nr:hypothetical protein [Sporomusa silvacetica]OZC23793.1 hypothetical protein SPSIL_00950 [Sporomusa silvacetica DSM 10669]